MQADILDLKKFISKKSRRTILRKERVKKEKIKKNKKIKKIKARKINEGETLRKIIV